MDSTACRRRASDAEQSAWAFSATAEGESVKQEPEWGECGVTGVSEAAVAEGLYAGHEVKDELVIGPEVVQQQDVAFSMQDAVLRIEEGLRRPKPEGGADAAPESTRARPGEGPHCDMSHKQRVTLRSCAVRLERILVQDLHLDTHRQTHTAQEPFSCNICKSRFADKSELARHRRSHTGEKLFSCDVCMLRFARIGHLMRHRRIHTGEKPFSCDVCKSRFTQKSHLTRHRRIHTGEKPFACDVCKSRFASKRSLTTHRLTHTGEKTFSCDVCKLPFAFKRSLTMHRLTHTGEKPFSCDVCKSRFSPKSHLTTQSRTQTGEKPFSCDVCKKRFALKST